MKLKYQETIVDCLPCDSAREQLSCQDYNKVAYQTVSLAPLEPAKKCLCLG